MKLNKPIKGYAVLSGTKNMYTPLGQYSVFRDLKAAKGFIKYHVHPSNPQKIVKAEIFIKK